jgi:hypothetical protein
MKKKKKKYMIFFFFLEVRRKSCRRWPELGGRWRWTAAGSGSWWLEMAAGPKPLGLKLVLKAL